MINRIKKVIAVVIVFTMLLSAFGITSVFATDDKKAEIKFEIVSKEIMAGQIFRVNVALDFEDTLVLDGGVMAFRCGLKFDPEKLEMIDPNTLQPVVYLDNGLLEEGSSLYKFGSIGEEKSLTAVYNGDSQTIVIFYGGTSENNDIFTPGPIVQFAFRPYSDMEINNSISTSLEIVSPEISVANIKIDADGNASYGSPIAADVTGEKINLMITPPFVMPNITSQSLNTTFTVSGRTVIGADNSEPIMAVIKDSNGNTIAEQNATISGSKYTVSFELDETMYSSGYYTITLSHGMTSVSKEFNIRVKEDPYVPPVIEPEPEPEPEPDTDTDVDGDINIDTGKDEDKDSTTDSDSSTNTGSDSSGSKDNDSDTSATTKPTVGIKPNTSGNSNLVSNNDSSGTNDEDNAQPSKTETAYPSDIAAHWAESNIKYVYDNSLMNGYSDGTFGPENNITRAEFVTVMARLLGYAEDADAAAAFTDSADHWAKGYIGALASKGIVGGVSETEFAPDQNITREQIAVILSRAFALSADEATEYKYADDSMISDWAYSGVYSVYAEGYMKGDTNNNFNPLSSATRAEVATIIYRLHSAM